jgi:molybdopterin synthase catalytic subunit
MNEKVLIPGPISRMKMCELISVPDEKNGGHSIFIGRVRADESDSGKVVAIEYSAYETMVEAEAEKIRKSIFTGFPDVKSVVIHHSIGIVKAGEDSLLVFVSAGHRQQAMDACNRTVEMVKASLPVWKKEIFEDNTSAWRENNPA